MRAGVRAGALQSQTCNASCAAPMHRAEPEATLSLLPKSPHFMHFFRTLMQDLFLRSKSLPEAPQDSESSFLRVDFSVSSLFVLSHPLPRPCQEHGFLQACSCARQSPTNGRKCALFPTSASVKVGGGVSGCAQGNLASDSPACHCHIP